MASSLCASFLRTQGIISVILYALLCITVTQETTSVANLSVDPCYNYTVLDDPRRAPSYQSNSNLYDIYFSWSGWYRLFINGLSAQIPDTCVAQYSCGTYIPLWLRGGHPRVQDGVVTRDVCGHWNDDCCYYSSYSIKVKACPGSYYVYELVSPTVYSSAYCAANLSVDPCYNYTVLDDPRRAPSYQSNSNLYDKYFSWSGWYRLFINGLSAQIPDTCVAQYSCGTYIPLWLRGGHPRVQDGVVTRDVCGHWNDDCCYYSSYSIKVKACPGSYYVYELVSPTVYGSAYCAANLSVDPCYNYTVLDDPRRAPSYQSNSNLYDKYFSWSGWYRLFINGLSAQIPDTCVAQYSCGTYIPLWLRGGHPRVQDGVVTRDVCGHWNDDCCYYSSYSIKVKACPGSYYVYELVSPTVYGSAYCAANLSVDPCYNYTVLDDPRRAPSYQSNSNLYDKYFSWSGWYRLFINGLSAQIPDTCVAQYSCGTYIPLWLRGGHPRVQDGVVTRDVCGHWNDDCCYYSSYSIKVKACPGSYYVYELVSPTVYGSAYCAANLSVDPCYNYTVLDDPRRAPSYQSNSNLYDKYFSWSGWYRLFINGLSAQIPDTCVAQYSCGTYIPLWLRGGHPRVQDGVVTRDVCGHWNDDCCYYSSYSIKVKACPGSYYVYELVSPTVYGSAYCAANLSVDPCYNYTVLDDPRRAPSYQSNSNLYDIYFSWSGWYRLFINGLSAQIPDTCVAQYSCGTYIPLWLRGGHPRVQDGVVTRDVCGHWNDDCCYYSSYSIKVKACPGSYYVYELVSPTVYGSAYCAANFTVDPCYNYTVLDDPRRAPSYQSNSYMYDIYFSWSGWYRLFINGLSAQIPDTCVAQYSCGTYIPLWLRGGHPRVQDGVVTRDVCGHLNDDCCYYLSYSIKVKACPGSYYVYELVRPTMSWSAYCAVINIMLPGECTGQTPGGCLQNVLVHMENLTAQVLPLNTVMDILNMVFNTSEEILESSLSAASPTELASYGNRVLKTSEKLISTLVKPTDTSDSVNFTLPAVEGQVFMVGPWVYLDQNTQLVTVDSSMDIDLIGIARKNNRRSAAVAFMSYKRMEKLLKPDFFNTSNHTIKTMMSTVISATLPKTTNTKLTKPVNFTFRHIREFDPSGSLSCVYWNISEWIVDGCSVLKTNGHYTVCSCDHLSVFALIMQTSPPLYLFDMISQSDLRLILSISVYVTVGVVFSLALLTLVIFIAVYFHV